MLTPAPVPNRRAAALQKKLRAAIEARVVRWAWAMGEAWPNTPYEVERLGLRRAKPFSRAPARPVRGTVAVGLDSEDHVIVKRAHQTDGVAEAFFERRGDVVDEHYFFVGEPRCTVRRYLYARGYAAFSVSGALPRR